MKQYYSYFVYGLYFILLSIGLEYELSIYAGGQLSTMGYQLMGISALIMLLYAVPLLYLLRACQKKWNLPKNLLIVSVLSGFAVAGWMSSIGNDLLSQILSPLFTDQTVFAEWEAALTAPFIEEPLKLAAAFFALHFFKKRSSQAALLAGGGAGLGFQLSEDLSYASISVLDTPETAIADTFGRLVGCLSSHWMMTALFTVGSIWILTRHSKHYQRKGATLLLLTLAFHFIWNSPYAGLETPFSIHMAALSGLYCLVFYLVYQMVKSTASENRFSRAAR